MTRKPLPLALFTLLAGAGNAPAQTFTNYVAVGDSLTAHLTGIPHVDHGGDAIEPGAHRNRTAAHEDHHDRSDQDGL